MNKIFGSVVSLALLIPAAAFSQEKIKPCEIEVSWHVYKPMFGWKKFDERRAFIKEKLNKVAEKFLSQSDIKITFVEGKHLEERRFWLLVDPRKIPRYERNFVTFADVIEELDAKPSRPAFLITSKIRGYNSHLSSSKVAAAVVDNVGGGVAGVIKRFSYSDDTVWGHELGHIFGEIHRKQEDALLMNRARNKSHWGTQWKRKRRAFWSPKAMHENCLARTAKEGG